MTKANVVLLLIIVGLVAVIFLMKSCTKPTTPVAQVKHDTVYVTIHDTFMLDRPTPYQEVLAGKPIADTIVKKDTVFSVTVEHVDTATILHDYFTEKMYLDTAKSKYGYLVISDTITQNKIKGRSIKGNWTFPQVSSTTTLPPKLTPKVFLGVDIGSDGKTTVGFGPQAFLLSSSGNNLYGLGANFQPGLGSLYYHVSANFKLHF